MYDRVFMTKTCLLFVSLALGSSLCGSAFAIETRQLAGTWLVESSSPQGMIPQLIELTPNERGVTGNWQSVTRWPWRYSGAIKEVSIDHDSLSFKVFYGPYPGMVWKGHLQDEDHFVMTLISNAGVPIRTREFHRVSSRELEQAWAQAPRDFITHKLPLPELRDLPSNGLALKPPMGWNSWNTFRETIDDNSVRETADALVSSGMRDAGYVYVSIDDGWQGQRDSKGVLHPNAKFPDMKALANYLHQRGLKFGIYSSPGPETCAGYEGSHGHEIQDARTFANWGVDLIKFDWCSADDIYKTQPEMQAVYQKMGAALQATHRPIVYSLSQYGKFDVGTWARKAGGNLWRTGNDTVSEDRWTAISTRFESDGNREDSAPGGWNDPDMMLVGLGGMTTEEYQTHMTLWAMLAGPLFVGNDLRSMPPEIKEILLNREVIAIDQDALGRQGSRVQKAGDIEVWTKPLADGSTAVAVFNRGEAVTWVPIRWSQLGLAGLHSKRELWTRSQLDEREDGYAVDLPRHGARLFRVGAL
jgi:alpha-galactosidase